MGEAGGLNLKWLLAGDGNWRMNLRAGPDSVSRGGRTMTSDLSRRTQICPIDHQRRRRPGGAQIRGGDSLIVCRWLDAPPASQFQSSLSCMRPAPATRPPAAHLWVAAVGTCSIRPAAKRDKWLPDETFTQCPAGGRAETV